VFAICGQWSQRSRSIGVSKRTGSDNLETCYCEEIYGEEFCCHGQQCYGLNERKPNKRDSRNEGMRTAASSLEILLRERSKIDKCH
jgi:hypothetical protein